jgi:hypothetical protein
MTNTTTTALPTWGEMTDVDRGAALLHLHKRASEGVSYAISDYPVEYFDHPALLALHRRAACRHAVGLSRDADQLSGNEHERLYNLALNEPGRRRLWAARHLPTNVYPVDTAAEARRLLVAWAENEARVAANPPSWWAPADRSQWAVLHRAEAGGQWHEVGGCDTCRG